jgi:hypothetical protein
MVCERDLPMDAIVDGSYEPDAGERAHLDGCEVCRGRLAVSRSIEDWLQRRETPVVPQSFTAGVMARISKEAWRTERVIDLGFNVAVAAGLILIIGGAAGVAWSFGLFTLSIDADLLEAATRAIVDDRLASNAQTVAMGTVLLAMTLGFWWWVESDSAM